MTKMVLRTTVFVWLCVHAFYGQENLCFVENTKEGCASIVTSNLTDKVIRKKTEFTISLRTDSGQDIIADCNWVRSENFSCDPATGFVCDLQPSGKFLVYLSKHEKCKQSGEFIFDIAHEKTFSCKIEQGKMKSDNASANANPESQKKYLNVTDEKNNGQNRNNSSTDESKDQYKKNVSEQETNSGTIIGVVFSCLLVSVVALLLILTRKKLVAFVIKLKGHKGHCVEAPPSNTALKDFENRKCLIAETADSAKTDTLEEKDAVLKVLCLRTGVNFEVNTNITNINPTVHDPELDIRLFNRAFPCDWDDNDCGSSSKQT